MVRSSSLRNLGVGPAMLEDKTGVEGASLDLTYPVYKEHLASPRHVFGRTVVVRKFE